ncbi:ribonuclease H-like domain-containing protein [Tanacetum coccineum]
MDMCILHLSGLHIDDKLRFVEEPIEIMDREVKRLKQSRIPIDKVRWNSRRDHNLWDIIVNGDLEDEATPSGEQSSPPVPKTAKQLAARRNQERIKSILLLAIPDEYLLKFHNVPDAKSLWAAIKSRFGVMRIQKDAKETYVSKEDINQKFLRSLPPSWSQIALIMRNKPDIDEIDIDDLYNNLRVAMLTVRVKKFIQRTGRNMDLKEKRPVSLDKSKIECYNCHRKGHFARECRSGRSQGRRPYGDNGRSNAQTTESSSQALVAQDGLGGYDWSNDFEVEPVNYALMAISSSNSSSSSDSEVQKCSKQCLESFKCLQKNYDTEREKHNKAKLEIRGYEIALESLESRILGHEKNELAWGEKYEFQNYDLKCREIKINNLNLELEKVVKERDELKLKIEKWEGSSKNLTKILNSQMSTHDKNGLGFGTQMDDLSNKSETDSENRNPLTPRADISFAGLDEYAFRNKIIESKTTETNKTVGNTNEATIVKPKSVNETVVSKSKINRDEVIIEDWTSDDEDDVCAVKTVSSVKPNVTQAVRSQADKSGQTSQKQGIGFKKVHKIKACFVCKSTDHLIKDCDFYKSPEPRVKNVVNTGKREVKPVWDYGKRVNHQNFSKNLKYPHAKRTFNPSAVLTRAGLVNTDRSNVSTARSISTVRPVYIVRPVSTARPLASKIAQSNSVIRPNHPRLDIVRPKASNSPIKRSYFTQPVYRPKDLKPDVKTFGVKNMTTVGTRAVVSKGKVENVLKKAKWVWRPKMNYQDHVYKYNGSYMLKKFEYGNLEILLQDHAVVDSGCSSHMTGNKAYLSDYEDFNRGFVAFGSDPKGGKITGKGKIKTANLDFDDVYFVDELNFKLLDESQVVLKAPRKDNMYSLDLKNIVPSGGTEFKNYVMNELCAKKGIKREFSVARTPQQNGVAERKNRTLIEAARTMLADSRLPIPFWAEAVNTACYVLNRVICLDTLPLVKPYESKTTKDQRVEENLHVNFLEDQPNVAGTGPNWMYTDLMFASSSGKHKGPTQDYILLPLQPHRIRIPVKDVVQDAQEQPSKNASPDKGIQDSKDVFDKEGQHQKPEDEQVWQDELEMMVT